jgi:hypothetical protein
VRVMVRLSTAIAKPFPCPPRMLSSKLGWRYRPGCRPLGGWAARNAQVAGGQGGELGECHCKLDHAVQIEPGLRPQSPENGSFLSVSGRLSAVLL